MRVKRKLAYITLLVKDYDEAIKFYIDKLEFLLIEDTEMSASKRWVLIQPKGSNNCCLLLAKASNHRQRSVVGNQAGGRVFLFIYTDDLKRDYNNLRLRGVRIVRKPLVEAYGTVMVFKDLYGNLIDLIEPVKAHQ